LREVLDEAAEAAVDIKCAVEDKKCAAKKQAEYLKRGEPPSVI
jgi:hypothetical protein